MIRWPEIVARSCSAWRDRVLRRIRSSQCYCTNRRKEPVMSPRRGIARRSMLEIVQPAQPVWCARTPTQLPAEWQRIACLIRADKVIPSVMEIIGDVRPEVKFQTTYYLLLNQTKKRGHSIVKLRLHNNEYVQHMLTLPETDLRSLPNA